MKFAVPTALLGHLPVPLIAAIEDTILLVYAVLLAKGRNATLVPLALVSVPDTRRPGEARLEHIQQAKDFLEAVQYKAAKHDVSIERFEVFTSDAVQSADVLVQQLGCDG